MGVVYTTDLSFSKHIDVITAKASSMLGFLFRVTREFCDPYTLKTLYVSYIRSHLEYASVIWSPFYSVDCDRIERVQRKFIIMALRHLGWADLWNLPPYRDRCQLLSLQSLDGRRKVSGALFAGDVLNGRVDCAEVLALYSLHVPRILSRNPQLLSCSFHRTNYGLTEPVTNTSRILNSVCEEFNWNASRDCLRSSYARHFKASSPNFLKTDVPLGQRIFLTNTLF